MVTVNIENHWSDGRRIFVTGKLVFSGDYPAGGGDPVDFGLQDIKTADRPPILVLITPIASDDSANSLIPTYIRGTSKSDGKIYFPPNSISAGNPYDAFITGSDVYFQAIFHKFV